MEFLSTLEWKRPWTFSFCWDEEGKVVRCSFTPLKGERATPPKALLQAFEEYLFQGVPLPEVPFRFLREPTPFQRRVWETTRSIPFGETLTYGDIADRIGHPDAARAIGNALGANPLPLIIPCHRVVGKKGPGGFSAGRDLPGPLIKVTLLRGEGVQILPG